VLVLESQSPGFHSQSEQKTSEVKALVAFKPVLSSSLSTLGASHQQGHFPKTFPRSGRLGGQGGRGALADSPHCAPLWAGNIKRRHFCAAVAARCMTLQQAARALVSLPERVRSKGCGTTVKKGYPQRAAQPQGPPSPPVVCPRYTRGTSGGPQPRSSCIGLYWDRVDYLSVASPRPKPGWKCDTTLAPSHLWCCSSRKTLPLS